MSNAIKQPIRDAARRGDRSTPPFGHIAPRPGGGSAAAGHVHRE
ncbi:MAG: hypothetical protein AB1705_11175 [Verrucomicrobiota bacterium]